MNDPRSVDVDYFYPNVFMCTSLLPKYFSNIYKNLDKYTRSQSKMDVDVFKKFKSFLTLCIPIINLPLHKNKTNQKKKSTFMSLIQSRHKSVCVHECI